MRFRAGPACGILAALFVAMWLTPPAGAQGGTPCFDQEVQEVVVEVGPTTMSFLLLGEMVSGDDAESERGSMDADADGTVTQAEVDVYEEDQRETSNSLVPFAFGSRGPEGITLDGERAIGIWVADIQIYNATGAVDARTFERDSVLQLNFTGGGSTRAGALPGDHTARFAEDFEDLCPILFDVARLGAAPDWFILTDSVEPQEKLDWYDGEAFVIPFEDLPEVASAQSPLEFTVRQDEQAAEDGNGGGKRTPGPGLVAVAVLVGLAAWVQARRRD